jgi:hypothetical protein
MKKRRPPKDVVPLKDLTSPEYPPAIVHNVAKPKKAGGWKNPRIDLGAPGAPLDVMFAG